MAPPLRMSARGVPEVPHLLWEGTQWVWGSPSPCQGARGVPSGYGGVPHPVRVPGGYPVGMGGNTSPCPECQWGAPSGHGGTPNLTGVLVGSPPMPTCPPCPPGPPPLPLLRGAEQGGAEEPAAGLHPHPWPRPRAGHQIHPDSRECHHWGCRGGAGGARGSHPPWPWCTHPRGRLTAVTAPTWQGGCTQHPWVAPRAPCPALARATTATSPSCGGTEGEGGWQGGMELGWQDGRMVG